MKKLVIYFLPQLSSSGHPSEPSELCWRVETESSHPHLPQCHLPQTPLSHSQPQGSQVYSLLKYMKNRVISRIYFYLKCLLLKTNINYLVPFDINSSSDAAVTAFFTFLSELQTLYGRDPVAITKLYRKR